MTMTSFTAWSTAARKLQTVRVIKSDNSESILAGSSPAEFAAGLYQLMGGTMTTEPEPTFREYADRWFRLYQVPRISKKWANESRLLLQTHLYPFFGSMKLSEIRHDDIQRFYNEKVGYAASTVKHLRSIMRGILSNAKEDGWLEENVMESKRYTFSKKETQRLPLEDTDSSALVSSLSLLTEQQRLMIVLPLYTGLRRGELLALQWKHIHLKERVISILQAVSYVNNKPELKPPKSRAGIRNLPIVDDLLPYLQAQGDQEAFLIGGGMTPVTKRAFEYWWNKAMKQIDMKGVTAHRLRHTFATAAEPSLDLKTLQTILGHSKADITFNRYVHPRDALLAEASRTLSGLYGQKEDSPVVQTGEPNAKFCSPQNKRVMGIEPT